MKRATITKYVVFREVVEVPDDMTEQDIQHRLLYTRALDDIGTEDYTSVFDFATPVSTLFRVESIE